MGVGSLEIEDGNGSIEDVMLAGGENAVENELGMFDGAAAVAAEGAGDPGMVEGTRSDVSCAKEGAGRIMERNRSGLERRCIRLLHLHGRHNRVGLILAKRNEVMVWVKARKGCRVRSSWKINRPKRKSKKKARQMLQQDHDGFIVRNWRVAPKRQSSSKC
jgi:hypothetical protein